MTRPTNSDDPRPLEGGDSLIQRIRDGLRSLGLLRMVSTFDELLAAPPPAGSRVEWLWMLLEPQLRHRTESRIERRIRESRLPERKTLDGFDFAFQPGLDRNLILDLATLGFLDQGLNVLLSGHSGTGKSHIAEALGLNGCLANRRVRYTTNAAMLADLNSSLVDNTLPRALREYTHPELLIIEEVGLEQVERVGACRAGLMQKVLLPRYQERRSTIITSNIPWESWGDYLGDHLGAASILDRLIHHSRIIVIDGPSYRDHEHRRELRQRRRDDSTEPKAHADGDDKGSTQSDASLGEDASARTPKKRRPRRRRSE